MIHFRKLVLQNFMSYREKTVVPLSGQGIVRIEGKNEDDRGAVSNMAGKSTILEGLLWCLFGKTLRGVKHDAVVNRKSKRNCRVSAVVELDESAFRFIRYRRDSKFQNRLRIFRGDREISFKHEQNAQSKLESILGCDFAAFVNSTVFGGFDGARRQFALLSDSDQKRILDSFLSFEKFELAQERTKELLRKSRENLTETKLALVRAEGEVSTYREKTATLLAGAKLFRDKERDERRKLKKQLKAIVLPNVRKYDKEIEGAEKRVEDFSTKLNKSNSHSDAARRSLNKLRKQILSWKSLTGRKCPTCGQIVSGLTGEKLLEHLRADLKEIKRDFKKSSALASKYERRLAYGSSVLKDLHRKQQHVRHQHDKLDERRAGILERISRLTPGDPFSSQIEEARLQYSKSLSRMLVLKQKSVELTRRIKALSFWEVGFGNKGVKTLVMREILPAMNTKLQEYASQVFHSPVELEFRPSKTTKKGDERESFHLHYKSKLNSASYLGESSGGRRRIDICCLLVFSWLARCSNLLMVDELLDGLDDSGQRAVLDILTSQRGSVFVISHNAGIKHSIGQVWTVRKKHGVSTLEIP